jgi:phage gp36-like protein
MAYVGVEEVRAILIGRRSDAEHNQNAGNELDNDQIEYAISSAEEQVRLALRRRYALPFDPVPGAVKMLTLDIATYLCETIFRGSTALDSSAPVAIRYDRARRMLDDLRFGRVDLDAVTVTDVAGGIDGSVFNDYEGPLFPASHIFPAGDIAEMAGQPTRFAPDRFYR